MKLSLSLKSLPKGERGRKPTRIKLDTVKSMVDDIRSEVSDAEANDRTAEFLVSDGLVYPSRKAGSSIGSAYRSYLVDNFDIKTTARVRAVADFDPEVWTQIEDDFSRADTYPTGKALSQGFIFVLTAPAGDEDVTANGGASEDENPTGEDEPSDEPAIVSETH